MLCFAQMIIFEACNGIFLTIQEQCQDIDPRLAVLLDSKTASGSKMFENPSARFPTINPR